MLIRTKKCKKPGTICPLGCHDRVRDPLRERGRGVGLQQVLNERGLRKNTKQYKLKEINISLLKEFTGGEISCGRFPPPRSVFRGPVLMNCPSQIFTLQKATQSGLRMHIMLHGVNGGSHSPLKKCSMSEGCVSNESSRSFPVRLLPSRAEGILCDAAVWA